MVPLILFTRAICIIAFGVVLMVMAAGPRMLMSSGTWEAFSEGGAGGLAGAMGDGVGGLEDPFSASDASPPPGDAPAGSIAAAAAGLSSGKGEVEAGPGEGRKEDGGTVPLVEALDLEDDKPSTSRKRAGEPRKASRDRRFQYSPIRKRKRESVEAGVPGAAAHMQESSGQGAGQLQGEAPAATPEVPSPARPVRAGREAGVPGAAAHGQESSGQGAGQLQGEAPAATPEVPSPARPFRAEPAKVAKERGVFFQDLKVRGNKLSVRRGAGAVPAKGLEELGLGGLAPAPGGKAEGIAPAAKELRSRTPGGRRKGNRRRGGRRGGKAT